MSRGQYYDPWAKVGQSATDAVSTYLASRPNAHEVAMAQADLAAKNALVRKYESDTRRLNAESEINNAYKQSQTTQLDNRNNAPTGMADIFRSIIAPVEQPRPPALASMTPGMVAPGGAPFDPSGGIGESFGEMQGPMPGMPAPADVRNERFTESMPEIFANAMKYGSDKPGNLGDIVMAMVSNMGGSGEQITNAQMGSGADLNQGYTMNPGQIRFDRFGNEVNSAPFKPNGLNTPQDTPQDISQGVQPAFTEPSLNLYDKAGDAGGISGAAQELYTNTIGQFLPIPDKFVETVEDRQDLTTASGGMVRALSINPKMPVAEITRLLEENPIKPKLGVSGVSAQAKMRSLHDGLSLIRDDALSDYNDPVLDDKTRREQYESSKVIDRFLEKLNVPAPTTGGRKSIDDIFGN